MYSLKHKYMSYKADSIICYSDTNIKEVRSSLRILQPVTSVDPVCPMHLSMCSVKAEHSSLKDFQLLKKSKLTSS